VARVFITGSADGLGLLAATELLEQGHDVVSHARNAERAQQAKAQLPEGTKVLVGDLANIEETKRLAADVNESGKFDVVIHNAGVYTASPETILSVNTLAPYILTCLIAPPARLIYLSSGMHLQGRPNLEAFYTKKGVSYSDSKLHVLMLSMAVARKWTGVYSNTVNPGWVPTKMGGKGAPDDLRKGYETQVWLATSNDEKALVTGKYFHHQKARSFNPIAADVKEQDEFLSVSAKLTGIVFPG
jgi:NAD(P)-dependent dehydrogenase (short-subunit alcohol dehydrogenase family)